MIDRDATKSSDDAVGPVVESFLAQFRRGERPALTALIAQHPELAEQLQEIIPALVELEQLGGPTGPFADPQPGGVGATEGGHPESLGGYRILRRIGGGGMGEVFEAEHESLKSRVALKVMQPRFRADEKSLRRFHVEARSAAGLHHTNIVSVFDYGEQGGVCYYAMQYIQGEPLDRVLEELRRLRADGPSPVPVHGGARDLSTADLSHPAARGLMTGRFAPVASPDTATTETGLIESTFDDPPRAIVDPSGSGPEAPDESPSFGPSSLGGSVEGRYLREVARVCAQVADALEYAHRSGVLHRDIKPSNLLLDALGNVWVTDFGLAKLEEGGDASKSQDLVGTLRYMAPERFRGVSSRSGDVYALGATLYELATLRPAFDGGDQIRLIDRIAHEPPASPRLIDPHIPRDLETIVLKALAKDPKDRFGSARELAEELRKFVAGHPILSRRISWAERSWRWCRRNPWLAAASLAAAATLTALAVGSAIAAKVYHDDRELIRASELQGRRELFGARAAQARASRYSRQLGQRFESLKALAEAVRIGRQLGLPADPFDRLRDEAIASLMVPDLEPAGPAILLPEGCTAYAFDAGMTRYAFRTLDGTIVVRNFDDGAEIARFTAKGDRDIWGHTFSPDGKYLASRDGFTLSVWNVDRGSRVWTVPGAVDFNSAGFSPDSRRIAVAVNPGTVLMHDLATGQTRTSGGFGFFKGLAFRPDGREYAVISFDNDRNHTRICRIFDVETDRQLRSVASPNGGPIAWSPDGSTLAIGGELGGKIAILGASAGAPKAMVELPSLNYGGLRIAFHPAGTILASAAFDARLRLWDSASGRERLSLHYEGVPAFSKDGRILVRQGNELRPWQVEPALEATTLIHASTRVLNPGRVSIHRDGRILAVGTDQGVFFWDLAHRVEIGSLSIGKAWASMFEPSGDLLTNGEAGVLRWPIGSDPTSGRVRIGPPRDLALAGTSCGTASDRVGRTVAVAGYGNASVAIGGWNFAIEPLDDCRGVSLSPDGKWMTTNNHQVGGVTVWRLPEGSRVVRLPFEGGASSLFSPDGRWLVTWQSSIRLWEVGTWREVRQFEGSFQEFSPDGRLGIIRDRGNVLLLVEIETGRILARLERPDLQPFFHATFSPDGSRLVGTLQEPPSTQVIDLRLIRRRLATMGLDWDAPAFPQDDPARHDLPPMLPLQVDYGFPVADLEHFSTSPLTLVAAYTTRIKGNPDNPDFYHHRAHALWESNRAAEALEDISRAILLRPQDAHLLYVRAGIQAHGLGRPEPAIADLESALKLDPAPPAARQLLAGCCTRVARALIENPRTAQDRDQALQMSQRALEMAPDDLVALNTRGIALYRAGRYQEALTTLEKSLEAGRGLADGFDLFFLAMAHHRLDHRVEARRCLDGAIAWMGHPSPLIARHRKALTAFRAEAEAVLAGPIGAGRGMAGGRVPTAMNEESGFPPATGGAPGETSDDALGG